jgi:hypothetical protein
MAKTNAELQKAYRQRTELQRLDIRIEGPAKRALARLAAHHGLTQGSTLTELLLKAERDVLATLEDAQRKAYYGDITG